MTSAPPRGSAATAQAQGVRRRGSSVFSAIREALHRARRGIALVAATYLLSVGAGSIAAHAGHAGTLAYRDSIVARAHRGDPAALANDAGAPGFAAAVDFTRNLLLAAVPETIGGLALVLPVALAAHQGWVGGIVTVDGAHQSRFRPWRSAIYLIVVLGLQLSGFTLAGGAGLRLGWASLRREGPLLGPPWFRLSRPALRDVGYLYLLVIPLLALGSAWEFFVPAV